jgi:hypothetical protein
MKKLAALIIAASVPATALPAVAQDWSSYNSYNRTPTGFVDGLVWQIDEAARTGRISPDQRRWLLRRQSEAKPLAWKVETNTASWEDHRRLNDDITAIERTLNGGQGYRGYQQGPWNNNWGRPWR